MTRDQIVDSIARDSSKLIAYGVKLTGSIDTANDLLQDMYLTILKYDITKLRDIYKNGKHFFLCARIMKMNHYRNPKKRVKIIYSDNISTYNPTTQSSESLTDKQIARNILGRELWKLEKFNRNIFYLYSVEKLSIRKMAQVTKINRGIIYTALCQARKQFQENLTPQESQLLKEHLSLRS